MFSFNINSLSLPEEQQKKITEWEEHAMPTAPTTAAARLGGGQIDAMKTAAGNTAGAMTGFMGMGMAAGANGMNAQNLFAMGQQPAAPQQQPSAAGSWQCSCGAVNKGKFCSECGKPRPAGMPKYKCDKCGWEPADPAHPPKFCPECGDPFDENDRS